MTEPDGAEQEAVVALRRIARRLPRAEAKVDEIRSERAEHFRTLADAGWSHRRIADHAGTTKENVRFWINNGGPPAATA